MRWAVALACAALACATSSEGTAPVTERPAPPPAPPADAGPTPPAQPPQAQGPSSTGPEPDRTQAPWSQTPVPPVADGQLEVDTAAGGRHVRLGTTRGAVHLWMPHHYDPHTAGVVLYIHGYFTSVDQAFVDHRLAEQFARSGRNALFIAAEAPSWNGEGVVWPDLAELLEEIEARAHVHVPAGPLVVSGHSGAIRTVLPWLLHPRVEEILLLDGLYRGEDELAAWMTAAPARRRLLLVGGETGRRTEGWLAALPRAVVHLRLPERHVTPADRHAGIVYWRSQLDHMAIVTTGQVLPVLLEATRAPALLAR